MDIQLAKLTASSFLEANRLCMNSHSEGGNERKLMVIPALVCAAFSAEVGLKAAIAAQEQPVKNKHDLWILFQDLSAQSQADVIRTMDMSREIFEAKLKSCRNTFEQWRYIYEDEGEQSVSLSFLALFAIAIEALNAPPSNAA